MENGGRGDEGDEKRKKVPPNASKQRTKQERKKTKKN
jgi:hypothetical protein